MYSTRGLISVVVLSGISIAFLWLTDIPPGIPGEWTWERISISDAGFEVALGAAQTAIAGVVYILVAWLGSRRIANCSRVELSGWLVGIATVGFGWMLAVQETPPSGWRMSKAAFVLYYPGSSGYFYKARYEISDSAEFLRGYEDLMAEGDVLHTGTHPPGLFLFYRTLINEMEHRPAVAEFITSTATDSITEAFEIIDANESRSGRGLTASDQAVIWLTTLLTQACCVLTLLPVFLLVRQSYSRDTSWRIAAFWPLLPALAIFVPKSDVLFVLPAALLTWTWLDAARRQSFFMGVLAGVTGFAGLFCSLAFLPVGLIAFVASLLGSIDSSTGDQSSSDCWKASVRQLAMPVSLWKPILGGFLGVIGLTVAVSLACEMNLLSIWIHNYHNHAAFYEKFPRTVWKWWLINPLELTVAAGVPVMFLMAVSVNRNLRSWKHALPQPLLISFLAVWTLLWLSGKNSGEAARLWCPLLPVLLAVSASGMGQASDALNSTTETGSNNERPWLILLACQAVVCAATVMKVSGFHFPS